jgi:hypothetical protein
MAAATVIHFGSRDSYYVSVLRNAGYEVRESNSLNRLVIELERDEDLDAVIMSEVEPRYAKLAAVLVRERSSAPLILFLPRPYVRVDQSQFDRVFSWSYPEASWLYETAVLVIESQKLHAWANCLRRDSEAVRAQSVRQRARAESELQRNADASGLWKLEEYGEN